MLASAVRPGLRDRKGDKTQRSLAGVPHPEAIFGPSRPRPREVAHAPHGGVPGHHVVCGVQGVDSRSAQLIPVHATQDVEEGRENMEVGRGNLARLLELFDTLRGTDRSPCGSTEMGRSLGSMLVAVCGPHGTTGGRVSRPPALLYLALARCLVAGHMRGLHLRASDPARRGLGRGVRGQTSRRWGEAIERECPRHQAAQESPPGDWNDTALDREQWHRAEFMFVNSLRRRRGAPAAAS